MTVRTHRLAWLGIGTMLLAALAYLLLPTLVSAGNSSNGEQTAKLHQIDGSGVRGTITFVDNGSTLTIEGEAWGLDPNSTTNFSLLYDIGSKPSGPEAIACEPSDASLTLLQMGIGAGFVPEMFWTVDSGGHGTLGPFVRGPGDAYVPLSDIGTVSIRDSDLGDAAVACGKINGTMAPGQS